MFDVSAQACILCSSLFACCIAEVKKSGAGDGSDAGSSLPVGANPNTVAQDKVLQLLFIFIYLAFCAAGVQVRLH